MLLRPSHDDGHLDDVALAVKTGESHHTTTSQCRLLVRTGQGKDTRRRKRQQGQQRDAGLALLVCPRHAEKKRSKDPHLPSRDHEMKKLGWTGQIGQRRDRTKSSTCLYTLREFVLLAANSRSSTCSSSPESDF